MLGRSAALLAALAATVGCSSTTAPDTVIGEVRIERVDVRILESFPPRAVAHVEGVLGAGCTELPSLEQSRTGNTVVVRILNERPREAMCTMIAKLYQADIPLDGQYPPGQYLVRVNGVERSFRTD